MAFHRWYIIRCHFMIRRPSLHSIPATIMEMFVYSRPGVIEFLPALSDKLTKGGISGVLCRTQAKVDELNWDFTNKKLEATISSGKEQTIRFQLRKDIVYAKADGKEVEIKGGILEMDFADAESRTIELSWK